jgi:predicted nucleic acid-binding protein
VRRLAAGGVIDASVAIKLVRLQEPLVDQGVAVLGLLSRAGRQLWAAPDIFDAECTNALRKASRHGGVSVEDALDALDLLLRLPHRRVATRRLAPAALVLALTCGVSAYDACYATLADVLQVPLVTADRRLVKALAPVGCDVVYLGDIEL